MLNLFHSKHYFIFIEGGAVLWAILIKMRRSPVILVGVLTRLWWKALWPGCLHWQHSSWLVLMLHQYSSSQRLEGKMLDLPGVATSKSFVYFWLSFSTFKSYKLLKFAQLSTELFWVIWLWEMLLAWLEDSLGKKAAYYWLQLVWPTFWAKSSLEKYQTRIGYQESPHLLWVA